MRWLLLLAVLFLLILRFWPRGIWMAAAVAALLAGAAFWHDARVEARLAQISLEVAYAPEVCPQGRPLRVSLTNGSAEELEKALFSIQAAVPGLSGNVTPYTGKRYASEKILQPGGSDTVCYEMPPLSRSHAAGRSPGELEWSASVDRVWFR